MERDLPDDTVNAYPTGGFQSGDVPSEETEQAGQQPPVSNPDGEDASARTGGQASHASDGERASDQFVESAEVQQGLDPDLATDEQSER